MSPEHHLPRRLRRRIRVTLRMDMGRFAYAMDKAIAAVGRLNAALGLVRRYNVAACAVHQLDEVMRIKVGDAVRLVQGDERTPMGMVIAVDEGPESTTFRTAPVHVDTISGRMPTQAGGDFDGWPFYFRARHGSWTLDVCRPGGDPVWPITPVYQAQGEDPTKGCMPDEAVRALLAEYWLPFEAARKALGY